MKLKNIVGPLAAIIAIFVAPVPALALFTPHPSKGLNSVVGESTIKDGSSTIKCVEAKASGGEINASGTESDLGSIVWSGCKATSGELTTPAAVTCSHMVFEQPNKEGTTTGKFTLKLNEDCTAKIGEKSTCTITLPAERNKKKEKGIQMKEVEEEGLKEKETSTFTSGTMVATVMKNAFCELLGVKETTEAIVEIPKIKQVGVGLE